MTISRTAIGWLRLGVMAGLAVAATASGCTAESDGGEPIAAGEEAVLDGMLRRVVAARMYQRGKWTIPEADTWRADEYPAPAPGKPNLQQRADYVCAALAYLRPTYVSGLVRFDSGEDDAEDVGDENIAEQAEVYGLIKKCVRDAVPGHEVHFDVVLNALQYTDPEFGVNSDEEGGKKLKKRLRELNELFHPDAWFFDFYTKPWNENGKTHHTGAMRQGINWIHGKEDGKKRQLVGGNAWGSNIPDGTDFISITDRGGMETVKDLADKITPQKVPLLMHVRNDPHIHKSEGVWWTKRGADYRRDVLKEEVEGEKLGYHYMYPVFFPLYEHSECHPGPRRSYNAAEDRNLLRKMCEYMDGSDDKCKTAPVLLNKLAPEGWDDPEGAEETPYIPRIAVHRALNPNRGQHLFSTSLVELQNAPALVIERENDFFLAGAGTPGTIPFHRCYLGNGWHLNTPSETCEGAAGAVNEGVMGYISPVPADGAVPLYRLFISHPDHFYTIDPVERDIAIAMGYSDEGITGYVWPE